MTKTMWGRKNLYVLINVCHLGKFGHELNQDLRQKTDKSGYCLALYGLTHTTSDQYEGVKSPTVCWSFPHDSTRNESCDWSPTSNLQAYFQILNILMFLLVSHLPRKLHRLGIDYNEWLQIQRDKCWKFFALTVLNIYSSVVSIKHWGSDRRSYLV